MPPGSGLARQARNEARHILSQPPFTSSARPSAFTHFFDDVGQWLYDVFGPVYRFLLHHLFRPVRSGLSFAFGSWWPVVLGAIVLVLAVAVGVAMGRRRARLGVARPARAARFEDEDPDELDAESVRAEHDGDFESAVRLRFRAGLARLERAGLITARRTHTRAQLAGMLGSPTFDALAEQLDGIVYAGRPATADQAVSARAGWPLVGAEARRAGAEASDGAR